MKSILKYIAEHIHPERNNPDYWLMKSLHRKRIEIDFTDFRKKHGKINSKKFATQLLENPLFIYIQNFVMTNELNFIGKDAENTKQFFYSRSLIHVAETYKSICEKFIKVVDETKDEFDKYSVIN